MEVIDPGVYIKTDQLERFACNVALSEMPDGRTGMGRTAGEIRRALRSLKTRTEALSAAGDAAPSAQWLLDNWYVAQRAGLCAADSLRRSGRVPALESGEAAVYSLARALVKAGLGAVDERRLELFVTGYQKARALTQREIAVLIPCLQAALTAYLDSAGQLRSEEEKTAVYENVFASMRFFCGFDASALLQRLDQVEQILRRDPAGIYARMDDDSRGAYRQALARLAARSGLDEYEAAEHIVSRARENGCHIGTLIFAGRQAQEEKRAGGWWYIPALVLMSLFFSILCGVLLQSIAVAVLLAPPVSEIVKNMLDMALMRFTHPSRLPRLELKEGIPPQGKTLCVISALLTGPESAEKYAKRLEEFRLCNADSGENLLFGILADLPEADREVTPEDDVILQAARTAVDTLNGRFGGGFCLFTRPRIYNAAGSCWMGWERKRGALVQLARLLRGKNGGMTVAGDGRGLENVRYLLTLDSDTRLCPWTAKEMVGAAMHPLNTPVVSEKTRTVTQGCGIIQPRISTELGSAGRTDFARIFAGRGGVDPYGAAVSDLYQDVFGRGSFTGKGLLDIDAFLACAAGRFRENAVLSHDLLEGALLRCAFMGDTELTDGCPAGAAPYYERLHRWVRGDWQNLRWMLRRVPAPDGGTEENPLPYIERWKIFDNLRRSMVPVFSFAALAAGLLTGARAFLWAAAVALLSFASQLLITAAQDLLHRFGRRQRLHCAVIPGFAGALMHMLVRLALLPYEAWTCASAAVTALYRMFVSHRNMLRWVTADQSEAAGKNTLAAYVRRLWPCVPAGLFTVMFAPRPYTAAVGLVWLAAPALAWSLSRPRRENGGLSGADQMFLRSAAGGCWRYFAENLTAEDNWLPPDNVQEQPALGRAHRTSPTNIGLALLSVLAAADLGFVRREEAAALTGRMLDTVEALPKWRGHLYNWYDTRTLGVLGEGSVSTVDSGNLAGCLIALAEGLKELDAPALADRAQKLWEAMDFSALYDRRRSLFYISREPGKEKPAAGWYDLLASEARLTSYIAVATGQAPRRHWRALGRLMIRRGGYSGLASWTGTMFEYLMPELLLPLYPDSLLYESARFCIAEQRRRTGGRPWGMSEGAFAAFDPSMSYRYKANGVQALALKRGMDSDAVVTPYASFLALAAAPGAAAANLRRLRQLGAEGKYGFYEALDYTPGRAPQDGFVLVRTSMAHHIGMSLTAADNALCGGVMTRRFMKNARMAAFSQLLQEKIPFAAPRLRQPDLETPEKPLRLQTAGWSRTLGGVDAFAPGFCLLSNGAYTVLMSETGKSAASLGGVAMTVMDPQADGRLGGVMVTVRTPEGAFFPAPWPGFDRQTVYETQFSGAGVRVSARKEKLKSRLETAVSARENGETRTLELCWNGEAPLKAEILFCFDPCLLPERDYRAHPAFARLGLQAQQEDQILVITRRPDGRRGGLSLCLACSRPASFGTSRMDVFGRSGTEKEEPLRFFSASPEFFAAARVAVTLEPGQPVRTVFALAPAPGAHQAREAAGRLLREGAGQGCSRVDAAAAALNMPAESVTKAMGRLTSLLLPAGSNRPGGGRDVLWKLGISGDFPVLTAYVPDESRADDAADLIAEHAFLRENGFAYDLLLLMPDGGDYRQKLRRRLTELLSAMGLSGLEGARGGIHFADLTDPGAAAAAEESAECLVLPEAEKELRRPGRMPAGERGRRADGETPAYSWQTDGRFVFQVRGRLPEIAWSHVLTNGRLGFLATDAGTGHMWYRNARENRINRWLNDPLAQRGTERLELLKAEGGRVSLFAAEDGHPCRVTWGFGFACWEKTADGRKIRTTAFVPRDTDARFLLVETENCRAGDRIGYYTDLVLGADDRDESAVFTAAEDGVLTARSPRFSGDFYLAASERALRMTGSRDDAQTDMRGVFGRTIRPCAAAEYPAARTLVLAAGAGAVPLTGLNADVCRRLLKETADFWARTVCPVRIRTQYPALDHYINGWALYQTIACRMLGRTGLYQAGGAYGFRDQLQDACAALWTWPALCRETVLRACAHQYAEGDVQHWWHESLTGGGDQGVRTRYTDDLLWLPYVLCRYVRATGDRTILREQAPYLASEPLKQTETERYEKPSFSGTSGTVLEHAERAAQLVLRRGVGAHGLCLMGGGDWNDGMNAVGRQGRGESVWLTWFAALTLDALAELCPRTGADYSRAAAGLRAAAENAWDGQWYLRGWYDSGMPLGAAENDECRIDSVAQSFAAFAGGDPEKVKTALQSAWRRLYDEKSGVVRLFEPPFDTGAQRPGYIRGYCPGFRENGGQYTHAAVWLGLAMLQSGMEEEGRSLLLALLPESRVQNVYKAEPYVLPADVSASPEHMGRAGWTWYTGSAGWYYTAAMEGLLGLELCSGRIVRAPSGTRLPGGAEVSFSAPAAGENLQRSSTAAGQETGVCSQ